MRMIFFRVTFRDITRSDSKCRPEVVSEVRRLLYKLIPTLTPMREKKQPKAGTNYAP